MSRPAQAEQPENASLWNFEFAALCIISVLAFCNLSIFYGFYSYLTELGIPPAWRGPLLALEPFTALVTRPFLGRYLTLGNGTRFMGAGLILATFSLISYPFATTVPILALIRIVHGLGFVSLVAGLTGILAVSMPRGKSAQGFGLFSITILIPYAIMPLFVELLLPHLSGHGEVYAAAAPLMIPAFLLLIPLEKRTRARVRSLPKETTQKPEWSEVRQNLRQSGVILLVVAYFFMLTGQSIVFFFIRDVALAIGAGNPGVFFTCANVATIAVRIAGGHHFDRLDKVRLLFWTLLGLGVLLPLFVQAGQPLVFFGMAVLYGIGMAFTMPLLSSSLLLISPHRLRAFNTNLQLVAMDAGFFAGPFLGGVLMGAGWTHAWLFALAGGMMLAAGISVLPAGRQVRQASQEAVPESTKGA